MRSFLFFFLTTFILPNNTSATTFNTADFFSPPETISARLSPDGRHIATIKNKPEGLILNILEFDSMKESTLLDVASFSQKEASLSGIAWIDNKHIAAQFVEINKGVKDLLDTKSANYLLIIQLADRQSNEPQVFSVRTKGKLVDPLISEENSFLYAKSSAYSKVYKLDVTKLSKHKQKLSKLMKKDGGQFIKKNEVASVEGFAARWFIDKDGNPKAALKYMKDGKMGLTSINKNGETQLIKEWQLAQKDPSDDLKLTKRIFPVALAEEENTFYCLDFAEEEERSVYKVNFSTAKEELVYEAESFKIIDLILSGDNQLIGVKVLHEGSVRHIYLNKDLQLKNAREIQGGQLRQIISSSLSGERSLLYSESHSQPGQFLIKNNINGNEQKIGSTFQSLENKLESQLIEETIEVDGLAIPYLLTLPEKKKNSKFPLIVLPHGGPIGIFDNRYFDPTTQFLAANGYAVLRVNFRGSSGHSPELKTSGKRQWGDLMLTDIYQATKTVLQRPDIDLTKVCAVGMSYGGYAAMMLTILHPATYHCAVNIAGVSDLNLYINGPNKTDGQKKWLNEQVGDPLEEYERLKGISPVYLIEKLQRPVMVIHGAKDKVVDIEHAYRLKLMLDKHNKDYSWHIFPEGTHSLGDVEVSSMLFKKTIAFIEANL